MDRAWQKKFQAEHQRRINRARTNVAEAKERLDLLTYDAMENRRPDVHAIVMAKRAYVASQDILQSMEQISRNTRQMFVRLDSIDGEARNVPKEMKVRRPKTMH